MDKQPVGQLPDLTQSNNDDEIMVITNDEYNQLKKEKISDLITDFTSTNENNALTKGTDGKLFVSKTINASDVDGVLSLDNIPQLSTNKLPETGISADNYSYPSSITVNDRGQVVSITEGSAAEAGAYLDQSQITNCILEAPNGVATFSGSNITLKQGLTMLYPNGRNADGTLKNGELTLDSDTILDLSSYSGQTFDFELMFGCNINDSYLSQNYQESDVVPTNFSGMNQIYLNTTENQMYFYISSSSSWVKKTFIKLGKGKLENGVVTSFTPYQPVELAKDMDVVHNTGDEKIGGHKYFTDYIRQGSTPTVTSAAPSAVIRSERAGFNANNYASYFHSYQSIANDFDITDETSENMKAAMGTQLISLDKNGVFWGYSQFANNYVKGKGSSLTWTTGLRRYIDGKLVTAGFELGLSTALRGTQHGYFAFPKCDKMPTTSSSAKNDFVDVIVKNYYSSTKGYVQFGSGLKIQWGRVKISSQNSATVTFSTAFQSTNYNVSAIVERYTSTSASYTDDATVTINSMANSSMSLYLYDASRNTYDAYVRWHAIGY